MPYAIKRNALTGKKIIGNPIDATKYADVPVKTTRFIFLSKSTNHSTAKHPVDSNGKHILAELNQC